MSETPPIQSEPARVAPAAARSGPVRIQVQALPWATIYVDGKLVGETPLGDLAVEPGLRVRALRTEQIVGQSLGELKLRERTGCSAVAIERGDDLLVQLEEAMLIAAGDRLFVCGANDAIRSAVALLEARA